LSGSGVITKTPKSADQIKKAICNELMLAFEMTFFVSSNTLSSIVRANTCVADGQRMSHEPRSPGMTKINNEQL
jgi:hypothetical protein